MAESMFQITGVSSGIDWGSIIEKTMEAGKKPATQWQNKIDTLEVKKTLYNDLSSEFFKLRNTLTPLKLESTYLKKAAEFTVYSPAGADAASIATATVSADAEFASWELEVQQIAKAQRHISARQSDAAAALNLSGKFRIMVDQRWTTIEVESSDTIRTLNQKIQNSVDQHGNSMTGITTKLVDNRIVIESANAGRAQSDNKSVEPYKMQAGTDSEKDSVMLLRRAGKNYSVLDTSTNEYGVQSYYPPQLLSVKSGGTEYIEGADFTYDRDKGTITWIGTDTNKNAKRPADNAQIDIMYITDTKITIDDEEDANGNIVNYLPAMGTGADYSADVKVEITNPAGGKFVQISKADALDNTKTTQWDYYVDYDSEQIVWNTSGNTDFSSRRTGSALPGESGFTSSDETYTVRVGGYTDPAKPLYSSAENKFYLEADDMSENSILAKLGFITVDDNGDWSHTPGGFVEAQDSKLTIDGVPVTRQTNSIDDLVAGVTIELKGEGKVAMNITQDAQAAVESMQAFVDQYNQVMTWVNTYLTEKSTKTQAADEEEDVLSSLLGNTKGDTEFGLLHGDSLLSSIKTQMRNMMSNPLTSFSGTLNSKSYLYPAEALQMQGSFYINVGGMSAKISVDKSDSLENIQAKLQQAVNGVGTEKGSLSATKDPSSLDLNVTIDNGRLVIKTNTMKSGTTEVKNTLTRGTNDYLPIVMNSAAPVNGTVAITSGGVAYTEGTDFRVVREENTSGVIQSRVEWLATGKSPKAGAVYDVYYAYNASAITVSGLMNDAGASDTRSLSELDFHQDTGKVQLSKYGITTESTDYGKSGLLEFDSDKFFEAIKTDAKTAASVMTNFMRDVMDKYIGNLVDTSSILVGGTIVTKGRVASKVESINTEITSLNKQITNLEKSLAQKQTELYKKYSNMEQAIQKMNAQMSSMTQYFSQQQKKAS